jgi:hypothetical protein
MSITSAYEAVIQALKSERVQVYERFTWKADDGLTLTLWPSGTLSLLSFGTPDTTEIDVMSWPPGSPLASAVMEMTR